MLAYAFGLINQGEYKEVDKEEFENIYDLFATILSKGIARQLKQGLYREYVDKNDDLYTLRGKINISKSIKNRILVKKSLNCCFDDFSANNIFNQLLKSTLVLLIKKAEISNQNRDDLKKILLYFDGIEIIDLRYFKWNTLVFSRNNHTYKMLTNICRFVSEGMLINNDDGTYSFKDFIDDDKMAKLYEKFILEFYRREHPDIKANAKQIPWASDGVGRMILPTMQSDVMLEKDDKILIIDAKYYSKNMHKHYDRYTVHSNNLYQIFAYVKNKELDVKDEVMVSGMLLYAKTIDDVQPDINCVIDGSKFFVKTLDLNGEFEIIKSNLDSIVNDYFK